MKTTLIILTFALLLSCSKQTSNTSVETPLMLNQDLAKNIITSKEIKIKKGEGFFSVLLNAGVKAEESLRIINLLRDEIELSAIKPGDLITLEYENEKLIKLFYKNSLIKTHNLEKIKNKWTYSVTEIPPQIEHLKFQGSLKKNSTLIQDLVKLGMTDSSASEVVNALMCKINFRLHARHGDEFTVLVKKSTVNNKLIRMKPLYIKYQGRVSGEHETFYYKDEESSTYSAHYLEDGQALIRSGLRYPLKRMHIRSHFGYRVHPVTGKRAFHRGVDLRGRRGDPVYAVASGKVILSSFNKYAGNTLGIRHKDGSTSYYYHLSKKFVKKGQWVIGRQKIASVGSTGRVTGAHLHFGFKDRKGKWINPMSKRMIATPKLTGKRFKKLGEQIQGIKETLQLVENDLVNNVLLVKLDNTPKSSM